MDLNKSREFFDPSKVKKRCHVIGCGAIGSSVAELLVRQGVEDITLWDFDKVERHNVVNQMYTEEHVGKPKTEALSDILYNINPAIKQTIKLKEKYTNEMLSGYVFICTDNIESRQEIVKNNINNMNITAFFDFRMTLTEGQHYAAVTPLQKESLLKSMDFTHEEAKANTPVSACGFELSVAPTVRIITAYGVANFTNLINTGEVKHLILSSPYDYFYEAY
jgi:molybdopterin/thiamine biosynthesis adenylyltransferase